MLHRKVIKRFIFLSSAYIFFLFHISLLTNQPTPDTFSSRFYGYITNFINYFLKATEKKSTANIYNLPATQQTNTYSYKIENSSASLTLMLGDMVNLPSPVEVIVNAANQNLNHAGGIAKAISNAAGSQLQKASFEAINNLGHPLAIGSAIATPAFNLGRKGIKTIIHAVGPDCRIPEQGNNSRVLLEQAYWNSLELAKSYRSIAFPAISSAIFQCNPDEVATIAINTIINFAQNRDQKSNLKNIQIVLFDAHTFDLYVKKCRNNKYLNQEN